MKRVFLPILVLGLLLFSPGLQKTEANNVKSATLYRDEFGIPHVFAPTLEGAAYAVGYAQAEDRLEELLKNYRRANGTMSEAFGKEYFRQDMIQRMWRHREVSREKYHQVSAKMRSAIESYQRYGQPSDTGSTDRAVA